MRLVMIMPIYNELQKGNLRRCLDNAKKVGFNNIIILDDGSTDKSYEYCKSRKDLPITVYRNEKNSLVSSGESRWYFLTNKALELSSDAWIFVQSADCALSKSVFNGGMFELLKSCDKNKVVKVKIKEVNLWRSDTWQRTDKTWAYWNLHGEQRIWKVQKDLPINMYNRAILHRSHHFPELNGIEAVVQGVTSIHYGFNSEKLILEKFKRYMDVASSNSNSHFLWSPTKEDVPPALFAWRVNSYKILEEYNLKLKKVKEEWFDKEDMPNMDEEKPKPISWDRVIEVICKNKKMAKHWRECFINRYGCYRGING